jgi:hypothetical protein
MNKSEQINELASALAKVQANLKPAPFDATNPFFKSKYASLGSVIEVAKVLSEHGLSYSQMPVSDGWNIGVENILMHESGQWISQTLLVPMDTDSKNPVQEAGKIITYARRYGLASMLGIYSDEDNDGNDPKAHNVPERKTSVPERQPTADRPYAPVQLKERLAEIAKTQKDANEKQMALLARKLEEELGDADTRHGVQAFLFGNASLTECDGKLINAGLKWLDISKDGSYSISDMAKKELGSVKSLKSFLAGQQKMDNLLSEMEHEF